jgi:hypothetical protein
VETSSPLYRCPGLQPGGVEKLDAAGVDHLPEFALELLDGGEVDFASGRDLRSINFGFGRNRATFPNAASVADPEALGVHAGGGSRRAPRRARARLAYRRGGAQRAGRPRLPGTKNVLTLRSEPAVASIFRERCPHRSGLDLGLELGDQFGVPLRFPVHRVLQSLELLLEACDARFEPLEAIRLSIARVAARSLAVRRGTADLADPCDQAFAVAHRHRRRSWLGRAGRGG